MYINCNIYIIDIYEIGNGCDAICFRRAYSLMTSGSTINELLFKFVIWIWFHLGHLLIAVYAWPGANIWLRSIVADGKVRLWVLCVVRENEFCNGNYILDKWSLFKHKISSVEVEYYVIIYAKK